jgi:protein-S-isoprenylcysteine O-methyltransferase Ste14
MSLVPAFDIGIWNAWILQGLFLLVLTVPNFLMGEEAKLSMKRMEQFVPFSRIEKMLALSTHVVIMPVAAIYSIFLPLKTGTAWLYVGLPIFALSLVMYVVTTISIANTPVNEPVIRGAYRVSRHPIYFSGFLMYIGIGVACASWIVLLLAVAWIVLWQIVVPTEERFLSEKYGDAYREYMDRTPKYIGIPKSG